MALTKNQAKAHRQACELVDLSRALTEDEREFVLDHWQASQTATHNLDGAYFTPSGLALDFRLDVGGDRIIDLCAGTGRLAFHARETWTRNWEQLPPREITCVERNPEYVRVGRKVLPEAKWIEADIFSLPADIGRYDWAISNPPFGAAARPGSSPTYTGRRFEYHVISIAATLADAGTFIVPQESAPFVYSGSKDHRWRSTPEYDRFTKETGLRLDFNVGIDTSDYDGWHGVRPLVEIVTCDFKET